MASETVHHTAMTLSEHLPILEILVPFVAAPLIVFIGRRDLAWPIAFYCQRRLLCDRGNAVKPSD